MDYKPGMFFYALSFLLGVVIVQQLPFLPDLKPAVLLFFLLLFMHLYVYTVSDYSLKAPKLISYSTLICLCIILIIIGISYSILFAERQLSLQLDESLTGKNILLTGRVSGIPVTAGKVQRFVFNVENYRVLSPAAEIPGRIRMPEKLRLSWYHGEPISAGQRWQLEVRLKPPHGFMNPGGFDYEAWLFQNGLHATGYVRKSVLNELQHKSESTANAYSFRGEIDSLRQLLSRQINDIAAEQTGSAMTANSTGTYSLVKALAIGDKSSISKQQWRVLTATGTSHLMAISGLHIGLAALFAYLSIRRLLPAWLTLRVPAQHVAVTGGMLAALAYALLAGLSIPTQRALIMLFVVSIMMLVRRNHRPLDAMGFALLLVLLFDPLSVLSAGFWFSFSAVTVIFLSVNTVSHDDALTCSRLNESRWYGLYRKLKQWLIQWTRLQFLISVFLLPLSLFMFQQVSLVSPLVNLVLIPYVSFLVVPVVLIAIVISFLLPAVANVLFSLACFLLDWIWPVLSWISVQPYALWVQGDVDINMLLLVTTAILAIYFSAQLALFLSRQLYLKSDIKQVRKVIVVIAGLLIVPVFFSTKPGLEAADFQVTVLDVGQGSAAVVQTKNHLAVFDTGAKFSEKMDIGASVVIPYLRSQGASAPDLLIVSHGDADHIGGAQAIIDEFPGINVIGQDLELLQAGFRQGCTEGDKWQWDSVYFEFLSPPRDEFSAKQGNKRNNHSCVLRVSSQKGSVLFTGDIEKKAELRLLEEYSDELAADILIVPHHGSNTSSSASFIAAVEPELAIFSVGYRNRYRLPAKKVLKRYESAGIELLRTDKTGAITLKMNSKNGFGIEKYRYMARKYWHHMKN